MIIHLKNCFSISVPLFVVGITEVQFIAYQQLIHHRLHFVNKLLKDFEKSKGSNENRHNNVKTVHKPENINSYLLGHFSNNKVDIFKIPDINCIRSDLKFGMKIHCQLKSQLEYPNWFHRYLNMKIQKDQHLMLNHPSDYIIQIQYIYSKLERTANILISSYSPHLIIILIMKFSTLTSLLYYCCMVIIK